MKEKVLTMLWPNTIFCYLKLQSVHINVFLNRLCKYDRESHRADTHHLIYRWNHIRRPNFTICEIRSPGLQFSDIPESKLWFKRLNGTRRATTQNSRIEVNVENKGIPEKSRRHARIQFLTAMTEDCRALKCQQWYVSSEKLCFNLQGQAEGCSVRRGVPASPRKRWVTDQRRIKASPEPTRSSPNQPAPAPSAAASGRKTALKTQTGNE